MRAVSFSKKSRDRLTQAAADAIEMLEGRVLFSNVPFVAQTALTTSAMHAHSTVPADVNGDGFVDVVTCSQTDGTVAWYQNNGSGSFTRHVISTAQPGARTAFVIDLDGDGDKDILSAGEQGNVTWYENDGNENFTTHNITTGNTGANDVSVADLNGDHHLDVIADNLGSDSLVWYQNDGSENFTPHTIATSAGTIKDTTPIDINGDGKIDILTAAQTGNKVTWYENDGSGSFTAHTIDSAATGTFSAVAGDLDGDGDVDVVAACNGNNSIVWYENDGSENFTKHTLSSSSQGAPRVYIADLDKDGDPDILSADFGDDKVQWFENLGGGNFSSPHVIATGVNQATDVAAADFDGDGDPDVVSASFQDNTIRWYKNTGGRLHLTAASTAPTSVGDGTQVSLLKYTAQHIGTTGDNADRLSSLTVQFLASNTNTPMTTPQATALFSNISVYRDSNNNGTFDGGDTLVATTSSPNLASGGLQTLALASNDANGNFGFNSPATFFVTATLQANASSQTLNSFRVSTSTGSAADQSSARVLVNQLPLPAATLTSVLTATASPPSPPPPTSPPPVSPPPVSPPPPPTGTGALTATATGTLPAIAVSGEKAKASVIVTVSNPSLDVFSQAVTINLYASLDTTLDGSDVLALGPVVKKLKIKPSRDKGIKLKLRGFPAGLSDGVYHVLAQVVPTAGDTTIVATDATSTVQAPFVNLTGTIVAPSVMTIGKKSAVKVTIENTGNVLFNGTPIVDVRAMLTIPTDVLNEITSVPVKLKLKPNHPKRISLKFLVPVNLTASTYTISAVLDSTEIITESNEGDNLADSLTPTAVQ